MNRKKATRGVKGKTLYLANQDSTSSNGWFIILVRLWIKLIHEIVFSLFKKSSFKFGLDFRRTAYGWRMGVPLFGNFFSFFFLKKKTPVFLSFSGRPVCAAGIPGASCITRSDCCDNKMSLFAPEHATVVSPALCLFLSSQPVQPEHSRSLSFCFFLSAPCLALRRGGDGFRLSHQQRRKGWPLISARSMDAMVVEHLWEKESMEVICRWSSSPQYWIQSVYVCARVRVCLCVCCHGGALFRFRIEKCSVSEWLSKQAWKKQTNLSACIYSNWLAIQTARYRKQKYKHLEICIFFPFVVWTKYQLFAYFDNSCQTSLIQ